MLLAALLLLSSTPASPSPTETDRAECLKTCAGKPKDATGEKLLACLSRCDPPASDAGVP